MRRFLPITALLFVGCNSSTESPLPVDVGVLPIDASPPTPLPPDAAMRTTGEPCDEGECARGACVHGVCSPLCAQDTDCEAGQRCIGRGGAGRCSVACDADTPCSPGLLCVVNRPDEGFCVSPGIGRVGDSCGSREDCESWFCSSGQCLSSCDEAPCPDGHRCLPLHTQSICTPAGPAERETPCQTGGECASGICRGGRCSEACPDNECDDDRVCVRWTTVNLCERRCARSADCGDSAICLLRGNQRLCTTRGSTADDEACEVDVDCHSGLCANGTCARSCRDDPTGCPPGWACVVDLTGALCRPAGPAPLGGRCGEHSTCATGVCGAGICTRDCADGGLCPNGTHCTAFANGSFCFPDCRADADCPGVAFCDRQFPEGRTCFWRGAGDSGDRCTGPRDCRSGHCANGYCQVTCAAGEACPAETRCVDADTADICTQVPLPLNAACHTENACQDGLRCLAGRCVASCDGGCRGETVCVDGWCQAPCQRHSECRDNRYCDGLATRVCRDPGPGSAGTQCTHGQDCADGLCLDGLSRAQCGTCADGEQCVPLGGRSYCVEAGPKSTADVCERHGECASGLCIGQRCVGPCDENGGCTVGMACEALFDAHRCVGACTPADGLCGPELVCQVNRSAPLGRCMTPAQEGHVGDACETSADCGPGSVGCRAGADGLRCRAPCTLWSGDGCEEDTVCATTRISDQTGACVAPGTAEDLAPCEEDGECASGWCVNGYLDGRCGRRCQVDDECPDGACVDIARNPAVPFWICAPGCSEDSDCETPLRCRRNMAGRAACY